MRAHDAGFRLLATGFAWTWSFILRGLEECGIDGKTVVIVSHALFDVFWDLVGKGLASFRKFLLVFGVLEF